jgi:hypothetical protein
LASAPPLTPRFLPGPGGDRGVHSGAEQRQHDRRREDGRDEGDPATVGHQPHLRYRLPPGVPWAATAYHGMGLGAPQAAPERRSGPGGTLAGRAGKRLGGPFPAERPTPSSG